MYLIRIRIGFFNVLVFTYPHVSSYRRNHNNCSWCKAFFEVIKSGGDSDRLIGRGYRRGSLRKQQRALEEKSMGRRSMTNISRGADGAGVLTAKRNKNQKLKEESEKKMLSGEEQSASNENNCSNSEFEDDLQHFLRSRGTSTQDIAKMIPYDDNLNDEEAVIPPEKSEYTDNNTAMEDWSGSLRSGHKRQQSPRISLDEEEET